MRESAFHYYLLLYLKKASFRRVHKSRWRNLSLSTHTLTQGGRKRKTPLQKIPSLLLKRHAQYNKYFREPESERASAVSQALSRSRSAGNLHKREPTDRQGRPVGTFGTQKRLMSRSFCVRADRKRERARAS